MSAQEVADTKRLGYPISHDQIANYESGRKRGLDITELLVLAAALEVSPIALLFPATSDREVEMLLRAATSTLHAVAWSSEIGRAHV